MSIRVELTSENHYRVYGLRDITIGLHVFVLPNGKLVYAGNPQTTVDLQLEAIQAVQFFREKEPPAPASIEARRPRRPRTPSSAAAAEAPTSEVEMATNAVGSVHDVS